MVPALKSTCRSGEGERAAPNLPRYFPFVVVAIAVLALVNTLPPLPSWFVGSDVFPILATSTYSNASEFFDVIKTSLMPGYFKAGFYRPVSSAIWGAEYAVWGLNPRPYIAVNVVAHMLNVILLIPLALVLFGRHRPWIGPVAATIFAFLPFSADNVPVISRTPDILSGTLILAVCAIHFAPRSGRKAMWVSCLLTLFAFGIKETAFIIPPLITLGHLSTAEGGVRAAIRKSWPFWLILFLFMILRFLVLGGMGGYPEESGRRDPLHRIPVEFLSTLLLPFGFLKTWKCESVSSFTLRLAVSLILFELYSLSVRFSDRRRTPSPAHPPLHMSAVRFLLGWIALLLLLYLGSHRFERRYAYLAAMPGTLLIGTLLLYGVRRRKGRLIAHVAMLLVSWNFTFAPLFGGYDEWKDGADLASRYVQEVEKTIIGSSPDRKVFGLVECPQTISYRNRVPYISDVFLLGRRSLRAYFSLRFPDRTLKFVVRPMAITEPPEG